MHLFTILECPEERVPRHCTSVLKSARPNGSPLRAWHVHLPATHHLPGASACLRRQFLQMQAHAEMPAPTAQHLLGLGLWKPAKQPIRNFYSPAGCQRGIHTLDVVIKQ